MCVALVDLAGFTAFAEERGDAAAADLAAAFSVRAMQAGRRHGLRPIKTIGDAVLLVGTDPADAARYAVSLVTEFDDGPPLRLHAGIADGPIVERDGDVFGSPVNLAAHLVSEAAAGEVVVTGAVAEAARRDGLEVLPLGARRIGLLRPLHVFRIAAPASLKEVAP